MMHQLKGYDFTSGRLLQKGYTDELGVPGQEGRPKDSPAHQRSQHRWFYGDMMANHASMESAIMAHDLCYSRFAFCECGEMTQKSIRSYCTRWVDMSDKVRTSMLYRYVNEDEMLNTMGDLTQDQMLFLIDEAMSAFHNFAADMDLGDSTTRDTGDVSTDNTCTFTHRNKIGIRSQKDLMMFLRRPFRSTDNKPILGRPVHIVRMLCHSLFDEKLDDRPSVRSALAYLIFKCAHRSVWTRCIDTMRTFWLSDSQSRIFKFNEKYLDELFDGNSPVVLKNTDNVIVHDSELTVSPVAANMVNPIQAV